MDKLYIVTIIFDIIAHNVKGGMYMRIEEAELIFPIEGRTKRLVSWLDSGQYSKALKEITEIRIRLNQLETFINEN